MIFITKFKDKYGVEAIFLNKTQETEYGLIRYGGTR